MELERPLEAVAAIAGTMAFYPDRSIAWSNCRIEARPP